MLQGDKDNYRAILVALQGVTGAAVSVAEKDREFVPVGIATNLTKGEENLSAPQATGGNSALPASAGPAAQVDISSTPAGADIEIDGKFVGSTPSTLSLAPGDHSIVVKKNGFSSWERKISVSSGHVSLNAELAKSGG